MSSPFSPAALGTLVDLVEYGSSAKSARSGRVPVLRMGNLREGRVSWDDLVFTNNAAEITRYRLEPNDVLFNRTNTMELVGKAAIYTGDRPAIFAGYLIRVRVNAQKADPRFLNFILNTAATKQHGRSVASIAIGQVNINAKKLKAYPIPLPPTRDEQTAIADAITDAESLLEQLDTLIATKRDLKRAAIQQLLTGRTRLPEFKGKWKLTRLGNHVTYLSHATHARAVLTKEGTVRYLHYGDVHAATSIWLDPRTTSMPFVPERLAGRFDRLQTGDLVFVDASEDLTGIGKSVELRGVEAMDIIAGLHTITARFDKSVLADGFKGYLQFMPPFKAQLQRLAAGTKVYASNKGHVSSVEIDLPEVEEQVAIANALNDMAAEIAALEARRDKTRLLKTGMMQELLTGRTRLVQAEAVPC
jgi:type I restriction enzyme S subunit